MNSSIYEVEVIAMIKDMKVTAFFFLVFVLTTLTGCQTTTASMQPQRKQMQAVLNECDRGQSFDLYVSCVKGTYQTQGTMPNSPVVRAFYSNLDMINESYLNKTITQAQAMSYSYDSYMRTIHSDNVRGQAASDAMLMNLLQMQQRQQINQQQRTPIQTNCIRNGPYTNCTSN